MIVYVCWFLPDQSNIASYTPDVGENLSATNNILTTNFIIWLYYSVMELFVVKWFWFW